MATSSRRSHRLAWLGLVLALLPAGSASAQATSAIAGAVTDARTGKPVVGATVQVEGPAIDAKRTVLSEAGGAFTVADLPAGTYALSVAMPGYEPYRRADLAVKENTTLRANVPLATAGSEVEEVVVTGSRIRRKDLTTAAPVTVIERKEIEASGVVGLGEFLQTLPSHGNALNAQRNYGNDGQVHVDLRSLEAKRTLVLVNGRRMVSGNIAGNSEVDLNNIPLAAVERIEVLKDGASALYGSEAIAGVVNVILKQRFEGTQLSAMGGVSSRGDAQSFDLSASTGVTGERGSAFFSASWQEQRPLFADARRWSAVPLAYDFESGSVYEWGSSYTANGDISIGDVETVCAEPGSIGNAVLRGACEQWMASGPTPEERSNRFTYDPETNGYRLRNDGDVFNFQPDSYLLTPARRLQLFSAGNYTLLPDVRLFYEASFVNRQSKVSAPPMRLDLDVSGQSIYNPFRTDLVVGRRLVEFGNQEPAVEANTFRIAGGLEGDLSGWAGPLEGWAWELSYVFGRNAQRATLAGLQRLPALEAAVGPSFLDEDGRPTCGVPGAPVPYCVPLDVLSGAGTLSPEQRRLLGFTGIDHGYNELHVVSLSVNGDLFRLWADRPAAVALGVDQRRESGGYFPDPLTAVGQATGASAGPSSGSYSAREAFAELSLPLLSGRTLVHELELTAALRNVRFTSFGANTSYKLGARWSPLRDLTLRGTWSTAFRAPSVIELYQGAADNLTSGSDPCSDPADPAVRQQCLEEIGFLPGSYGSGQIQTLEGGNPHLRPETAKTLTAGVVLEPRWVKDLSLTLDYWDIQLEDTVDVLGPKLIFRGCYTGDAATSNDGYCDRVHRDPSTGRITYVDDRLGNIGGTRTSGVDFAARWTVPVRALGRFGLSLDGTYLLRFDKTYPEGDVVKAAGNYDLLFVLPRWRWNAGASWQRGGVGLSTLARYFGALEECAGLCTYTPDEARRVSANLVFDVAASYQLRTGVGTTAFQLGVRNVLDSPPPMVFTAADNNTDPAYDYAGRYWWGRLTQTF